MFYVFIALGLLFAAAGWWSFRKSARLAAPKQEPWWRPIMTDDAFASFREEVSQCFKARNETFTWAPDFGLLNTADDAQFGLGNLAQICARSPREEWKKIIAEHFDKVSAARAQVSTDEVPPLDQVRDQLCVRLMTREAVGKVRDESVWREDLEGVISMLALDYPDTVISVPRSHAVEWGLPDEELFAIALHNLARHFPLSAPVTNEMLNGTLHMFSAQHFFAASHALLLQDHPELQGRCGTLVAIPTRHFLITLPVNSMDVVKDMGALINVATRAEADGPGSITNELYFWNDGTFRRIRLEMEGNKVNVTPPPEFLRVLDQLSSESSESAE